MRKMVNAIGNVLFGSPKQERGLKNINDFLTEYFNNILERKNTPNLTVLEECNILMKLRNIKDILTPNTSFISKYEYKDIIAWLSNNTRSIFNETLIKPNSGLAEFIHITALDFSNYPLYNGRYTIYSKLFKE
ncbi:hypothetical protein RAS_01920 [Rickettsia asiatica]|uniref:Uncharacterized protein n=1 Tax=Rickettsia asiatica TaxID=238800 RepID=A0A510G6C8_9RICK|nr:hypothetical protein [Rickettsia asiatica]BBJ31083.1 hypothetical protein RAS_01920 [Rickettsia asiatica]